jgi:cobalt-zinc-cadmium efflux system membrane fusion protein
MSGLRTRFNTKGIAAIVSIASAAAGCRNSSATMREPPVHDAPSGVRSIKLDEGAVQRLGVKSQPAGSAGFASALHVPGTLDYDLNKYAEVGALLEGRVSSVKVTIGDRVKTGQVLATLVVPSIANAQAEYLTAQAAAAAARKNVDREESLLENQLTTAREAEAARSEATKTEAELAAVSAKLKALRVALPHDRDTVGAAGSYSLTTPIDGVVVKREAVLGAFLEPNKTAFAVADLSNLWATLDVYESDIAYLRVGAAVKLTFDAIAGKTFEGTLALLDPQLGHSTRSVRARVSVANPDGELRPGLFCRASIDLPAERTADRLLVPAGAVQPLGDQDVIFIDRSPGTYEIRPVRVGRRTAEIVELAEGVTTGEPIVVEGAFLLRGEVTRQ